MAKVRVRHSRLYYRNTLLVWAFGIFAILAALYSPSTPATFVWLIPLIYLNYTLWQMYLSTHPVRVKQPPYTPADATLSFRDVTLTTGDGLKLAAWYVPGKNRAAVILVHGLGGSKVHMLNHARALAFGGYGVLMLDLRAHGGSEGDTVNTVSEAEDVLAGAAYLRSRPDVDAARIGALGVSLGAVAVLRAARQSESIRAVILESIGPLCLADHGGPPRTLRRWVNYPLNWLGYRLLDWIAGKKTLEGVTEALPHIWPRPVMLVAAGRREIYFNRIFFETARDPKELWEVPRAAHAAVYLYEPQAYRDKMRAFFEMHLLGLQN